MSLLAEQTTLRDTYTVVRLLGEGAFSEVYLARHRFLGLQALKVFRRAATPGGLDPFREAFILSRLEHPNIIRIFDANTCAVGPESVAYLSMEYLEGGTLADFLAARPPLPVAWAVEIEKQICRGLAVAHGQSPPIVHRDIKPQNVLLSGTEQPSAKVADFGLARNLDPVLRMASAAGTLCYMPPEGFLSYATPAGDVYSAGLVFYEMLTASFPYAALAAADERQVRLELARSRAEPPLPPSRRRAGIPPALDGICLTALQPDARRRFPTAAEFLAALEGAAGESPTAREGGGSEAHVPPDALIRQALLLGRQFAQLPEAIEQMERALAANPALRAEYEPTLRRWKAGLVL